MDGSYNGSFEAISAGIEYLQELGNEHVNMLLLGDMRELGVDSKELHEELAGKILELNPAYTVLVGEEMRKYVVTPLKEAMGEERVLHFANARIA